MPVGDGRYQHVAIMHRGGKLLAGQRDIAFVEHHVEQFAHPRLDFGHQMAGDDNAGAFKRGAGVWHGPSANA